MDESAHPSLGILQYVCVFYDTLCHYAISWEKLIPFFWGPFDKPCLLNNAHEMKSDSECKVTPFDINCYFKAKK